MKRFAMICVAALALMGMAEQKASAWTKSSFSVGLSFNREASDNRFMYGLIRNGPAPYAQGGEMMGDFGGHGYPISEGMPTASMQYAPAPQLPMLPAPRPMPTIEQQRQTIAPASYWTPYYWPGN